VPNTRRVIPPILLGFVILALVWSGIQPYSRLTWLLEVFWVILAIPLVLLAWRRFPLTTLLCCLLALHAAILIVGGHYTYSRTPVGDWLRFTFDLSRNPYDRIGHFVQGLVPAILVREILVRGSPLRGSRWLGPLVVCACLAFSAFFEMLEWWAAVAGGEAADDFLATQGDVWDTQWDMFLALIGAILSLLLLSRLHDRQLATLAPGAVLPGPVLPGPVLPGQSRDRTADPVRRGEPEVLH
jgi:putative membrane protein